MMPDFLIHIAIFTGSLVLLAKGADYFVAYSGRIASRLGISEFIIGLTLTSVGTSIPELAASISASFTGLPGLVIGNVTGSNIANIGLILGVAASFSAFKTEKDMYERDGYIMLFSVLLFFWFVLDNFISTLEAIVLLAAYLLYFLFLIRSDSERKAYQFRHFMRYIFDFEYLSAFKKAALKRALKKDPEKRTAQEQKAIRLHRGGLVKDLGVIAISLGAITIGAIYLVREAEWLANLLGVPESIIGLSMIAIGTSLPELTVSLTAVKQGRGSLVVGNVLGSNTANILLIVGVSGIIHPMRVAEISVVYTIPILLFFSLGLLYFVRSDWEIKRGQGIIAVCCYLIFIALAFVMGWS